jgi:hypothetical protein
VKSLAGFAFGIAMYGMGLISGLFADPTIVIPIGGGLVLLGTVILWISCLVKTGEHVTHSHGDEESGT